MTKTATTLCLCSLGIVVFSLGCTAESPEGPGEISKDEARVMQGKADGFDFCDWFGWYGDGECDEFCPEPDPDCEGTCTTDADCPQIVCVRAPCPSSVCVDQQCVIDNPEDSCGAGERECATCNGNSTCTPHGVSCPLVNCGPERCGGIAGLTCSNPDDYCDYGDTCGRGDQMGECSERTTACPRHLDPVCGCDGNTYGNSCNAAASGVSVEYEGECVDPGRCEPGERECGTCNGNFVCTPVGTSCPLVRCADPVQSCGSRGQAPCPSGEFCRWEESAICGATDLPGTCAEIPTVCTREYRPVCGCDNNTYSNRCGAEAAGVSVAHDGAC